MLFRSPRDTFHLHGQPPPASTGYCLSTVDLLQPPHATIHPRVLFIQPPPLLHWLLFNHPSPRAPVQPPLHGLLFNHPSTGYCSSTIDLLQPPPAIMHPRAPVHPASTTCYSTGYYSTTPFHGLLFNHPSTGYYSSTPPPSTVHPALHEVVLFIQPSTKSCSSSPNRLDRSGSCSSRGNTTGSCSSTPTGNCSSTPLHRSLFRGSIDRLQLAAVANESLDRVQLTAIDRSLGFSNA